MPDWSKLIQAQLADLNLAPAREAEIAEELAQHAADRYRELLSGGASEADALRIALEDVAGLARELRPVECAAAPEPIMWGGGGLLRDIRYGLRSLRSSPGLTLVIVAVLGIGIGAAVGMFSVVDAAFLRPLRLPEPERLVQVQETTPTNGLIPVAYPDFVDWEKQSRSFESMGTIGIFPETLKRDGGNERVQVGYVSPGFHRTFGLPPAAGRMFTADDGPAAMLGYRFWQSHFAGDRAVIGRKLITDDRVWTIVGVSAPLDAYRDVDVFVPVAFGLKKWGIDMREQHSSSGVTARLKPGVTIGQAQAEMELIAAQLEKQYPGSNGGVGAVVLPLRDYLGGNMRQTVLLMFGAVSLLLLIACANVAGLLLARAAVRRHEMSIRAALGAGRFQLIRQLLVESSLLALAGAAAGVAVASASLAGLVRIFPASAELGGIAIDARVLTFSVLAAAATAILFGLAPAIQFTRPQVACGRGSQRGTLRMRTRKLLVVGQVALAVVLAIGAGLLMRSLLEALNTDPGFRPERIVVAAILPADRKDADLSDNSRMLDDLAGRLSSVAGVQAVGGIDNLPFSNSSSWADFYRDDRPVPAPGQVPTALKATATPGFFRAMGIPLLRGRLFNASDGRMPALKRDMPALLGYLQSTELVAVINKTMARRFWPGEDPIGKSFRFGPPSMKGPRVKIVGVVGDVRQYGLDQPVLPQYFFSTAQFPVFYARLVVRTTQDVSGLASVIRGAVAERQPEAAVANVESMETVIGRTLAGRRNNAALLGLFSGAALLLAAVGLYATMAYIVAQRTREIGVRMALGAAAGDVRLMVLREGAILAGIGVAIGLAASLAGARVVSSLLYGIAGTDALTYAGSALLLTAVMLAASYVPAWRASRVDPIVALRFE